jgi:hypothetical protein
VIPYAPSAGNGLSSLTLDEGTDEDGGWEVALCCRRLERLA